MPTDLIVTYGLTAALLPLLAWIAIEDWRHLEVTAALPGAAVIMGFALGTGHHGPGTAAFGAATGLCLGLAARLYARLRTGIPAFGGADILLMTGGGAALGPFQAGPWILSFSALALLLALVIPRRELPDGKGETDLLVLPLCPAISGTWAIFLILQLL